ncbi:MAG TPA: hypothetical protein VHU80_24295 [Polyangiaceae bacterium]|nr:hypothetical protein [Polyangiaceae bacterium]
MRRSVTTAALTAALSWLCAPASRAHAAEASDNDAKGGSGDANADETTESGGASSDSDEKKDAKPEKPEAAATPSVPDDSPVEEKGKTYRFIGARYRGIIFPKFLESAFASGGRTVYVNGVGPEFAIRRDGFEYDLSPWLAFYDMRDTAFKGSSDSDTAWELVSANLTLLYLTSDFLWSHSFSPEWSVNYGLGVGLGFVFGTLHRVQSYPTAPGQNPNDYAKCDGPGQPAAFPATATYCDASNNHYANHSESSWANGGSKPNVFPWFVVQTGVRFKPSRTIAARLDLGFGTSGFFFGLGGDYGL